MKLFFRIAGFPIRLVFGVLAWLVVGLLFCVDPSQVDDSGIDILDFVLGR